MSTVRKDVASGTWYFVHDGPRQTDGRRRQVRRRGFATKRECEQALRESETRAAAGELPTPAAMTVADLLHRWLEFQAGRRE